MPIDLDETLEVLDIAVTASDLTTRNMRRRGLGPEHLILATIAHRLLQGEATEALRAIAFETHVGHHPSRHRPDRNHPAHEWGNMSGSDEEEDD